MKSVTRKFGSIVRILGSLVILCAVPAFAQVNPNEPDPSVWVKSVYDLYVRAEKDESLQRQANYRLVVRRASRSLAALFRRDEACMKRNGGGPCAIDADFIVNGQDNELTDIVVSPAEIAGDRASSTVQFKNFGEPNRNVFRFVREGGVWKVDDIVMQSGSNKPGLLSTMLKSRR